MSSEGRADAADPTLRRRIDDERVALAHTVEELAARLDWRSRIRRRSMVIRDTARARWHRLVHGTRRRTPNTRPVRGQRLQGQRLRGQRR